MAIQPQYCRCWYLIPAACMLACTQASDITWLQWTEQTGSYIGVSSDTSRVPHSDVAAMCKSEEGVIIDSTVVDVTSQEFATLISECFNFDITNSHFWVNGREEEGYCSSIVLQGKRLFETAPLLCTHQIRYLCYSTQDKTAESCAANTTESAITDNIIAEITEIATTGESVATGITTGDFSTTDITTGESTTTDTSSVSDIDSSVAIYAGSAAGGAAILIIVTILIVYCKRKTRHGSPKGHVYINAGSVTNSHMTTDKPRTSSLNSSGTEAVPPSNSNVNQGGVQELKQGSPQEDNPDYTALSSSSRDPLPEVSPYEGISGTFDPDLHDQVRGGGVPYAGFTIQSADGSQRGDDTPYEDVTGLSL